METGYLIALVAALVAIAVSCLYVLGKLFGADDADG